MGRFSKVILAQNRFDHLKTRIAKNSIWRSTQLLEKADQLKAILIFVSYAVMGILDVVAVLTVGVIGSLAVSGVSAQQPGNRIQRLLEILSLDGSSIQKQVGILGLIAASILVCKSLVSLFLSRKILLFLSRRSAAISQRLIGKLLNQDILLVRKKSLQEIIYSVTRGVDAIVIGVLGAALLLGSDVLLLVIFSVTLFAIDTTVAVSSLIFFAGLGIVLYRLMHTKATSLGQIATRLEIESGNRIAEIVSCYRELLVKDRRSYYSFEIGAMRKSIAETSARLSVMNLLSKYIMEISMVIGGIFVGAIQFLTQPATRAVAVISVFLVSSARIVPGVLRVQTGLVGLRIALATAKPTIDMVESYLAASPNDVVVSTLEPRKDWSHRGFTPILSVESLSFTYPRKMRNTVHGIDLRIEAGEFIGIVGPSGSGKSTLVDLFLGILKPDSGSIEISGHAPMEAIKRWPGAIGYVPQDANFINGSIKENICLGFPPNLFLDEELEPILRATQLEELLKLPEGIHTSIGEKGNKLSGGQRQRLGIARALLTHPKILILDEATSSLDAITESKLTDYLEKMKGKLTLIVIAHRLSTVRRADRIIYLQEGEIRGIGDFESLRKNISEFDTQATTMGFSQNKN